LFLQGSGRFSSEVVGESYYQDAFVAICGEPSLDGVNVQTTASLMHEPQNEHDRNAISVWVEGRKVGHLPREKAVDTASWWQVSTDKGIFPRVTQ